MARAPRIPSKQNDIISVADRPLQAYEIVDRQTGGVVGTASSLQRALRSVDRRDNQYGAYRYFHRRISDK
jgi:hypothetical protein